MRHFTRAIQRSARQSRVQVSRQQRRYESKEAHDAHHDSHQSSHGAHSQANESFGSGFYIGIMAIPAAIGIYTISRPGKDGQQSTIAKWISAGVERVTIQGVERNALHTAAIEQAAADRHLFLNDPSQKSRAVELRYPEFVNTGSPWNVPAGHGSANIDAMIEKYRNEANEANERKLEQLRTNTVPAEQPLRPVVSKAAP